MDDLIFLQHLQSDQINEVAEALKNARSEMESARKNTRGNGYNYATLDQIINLSKIPLAKNDLEITQTTMPYGESVMLVTQVTHTKTGQFKRGFLPIKVPKPIVNKSGFEVVNEPQRFGSGMTYARRYALAAILSLPQEDNDGLPMAWEEQQKIEQEVRMQEVNKQREELEREKQQQAQQHEFNRWVERAKDTMANCTSLDELANKMDAIAVACKRAGFTDLTAFNEIYNQNEQRLKGV